MKLKTVHVTNFRSAEDSEKFDVMPLTCLVGKNESGKSAILLALAALNPHEATPSILNKERDYPRRYLTKYDERHSDKHAVVITTEWKLNKAELKQITTSFGEDVLNSKTVTVLRRYGCNLEVHVELSFKAELKFLFGKFALNASERSVLSSAKSTSDLIEKLNELDSPTEKHQTLRNYLAEESNFVSNQIETLVKNWLPKFMYFSSYDRMCGAVQLEQITSLISNGEICKDEFKGIKLFNEFLKYAGVSVDEILEVETYETFNAKLQAASNSITDQILEYWTQNPDIEINVRVEGALTGDPEPLNSGTIARARIRNILHRADTPFSESSAGFVWFFSFLVKFDQVKKEKVPVILLLDEPGLSLHGKAQADLQRFFKDKLIPYHQLIYTTHSPFMVPIDNLDSIRTVSDLVKTVNQRRVPIGTKVKSEILTRDSDTLFPLQGALGYEITQSLFIGKHTLLVEGPSDILYLQALSNRLSKLNRVGLDPRWTLCPAGGIDKIMPFVSLFSGNQLHIAVLSDKSKGSYKKIENIRQSEILQAGHFYTVADFLNRTEADCEDIFAPEIFVKILNSCYALKGENRLTVEKLNDACKSSERLVKKAEAVFKVMPQTVPMYDHFTPAAWIFRNPKVLEKDSMPVIDTLKSAERIFQVYNNLLP